MKHFQELYRRVSILTKIRVLTVGITTIAFLLVFLISYIFSQRISRNSQRATAHSTIENASIVMENHEKSLIEQFVNICGTENFANQVRFIVQEPNQKVLHTRQLQSILNDLRYAHYLVNSSLIVTGDGLTAYSLYSNSLQLSPQELFPKQELNRIHKITWLPERRSPFQISATVIPVVIPLRLSGTYLSIVNTSGEAPDLFVIFLIDQSSLLKTLSASNPLPGFIHIYLYNSDYDFLTSDLRTPLPDRVRELSLSHMRKEIPQNDDIQLLSSANHYLFLRKLPQSGLFLVCSLHTSGLWTYAREVLPGLLPASLTVLGLLVALSLFTTNYITRPILKLVNIVGRISCDQYNQKESFHTQDEMGQLLDAINQMYDANIRQMKQIRDDEKEKYRTELKLLSAQINPHFLYNTLEEIQSEVLRENKETASRMIQYLADYLRIGLSGGADEITIANELRHASAYIHIMNQRFGQHVIFTHHVDPSLPERKILKTILQPLLENSIRHGFGIDANGIPVPVPTIEVRFSSLADQSLRIEVMDNGSGFNVEEVRQIMTAPPTPDTHSHVGINNTWLRLQSFYGEENVRVQIQSIPYFQNTFVITICNSPENIL